jgi:hypothetical protein
MGGAVQAAGHKAAAGDSCSAIRWAGFHDEKHFEGADERLACMEQVQCSRGAHA